jgi:hypothetical protein
VIVIILFIIEIKSVYNFVENSREKFHELVHKYPSGAIPDNWNLITAYIAIKDKKCCGIDDNQNLPSREIVYFYKNFLANCVTFSKHFSTNSNNEYQ